ncbi:aspartate dehydrogenase [Gluconobacter aidae]|nr:aspartate dehydrogenase [Gluconobacter aidae]
MIGIGAIARHVVEHWQTIGQEYELRSLLARRALSDRPAGCGPATRIFSKPEDFLAMPTDIVVEAAGHAAVASLGPDLLEQGRSLYLLSVGALADDALSDRLCRAALQGGGRILLPCGALAGFDGLLALTRHQNAQVTYTSRKPVHAWAGTVAATRHDLSTVTEPLTIFEGSAREAARQFPQNANLAAAVAFAGVGLDATRIILIADPHITENIGTIDASGPLGTLNVTVQGRAAQDNPKTSAIVGASVLSALANQTAEIRFI